MVDCGEREQVVAVVVKGFDADPDGHQGLMQGCDGVGADGHRSQALRTGAQDVTRPLGYFVEHGLSLGL